MTTLLDRDFIPKQIVELKHNQANSHKVIKLKSIVDALLKQMLVRGFYGEVTTRTTGSGAPVVVKYIAHRPSNGAAPKAAVFLIGRQCSQRQSLPPFAPQRRSLPICRC